MDKTTTQIVEYARSFTLEGSNDVVLEAALNHLVDTVAVAIAGYRSEPAEIAAAVARRVRSDESATVIGFGFQTTPEMAAFCNTIMVRTYDWNDGMQAKGGGHPSDMISALLAVAELSHATGADLLMAVALAYELLGGLGAEVPIGALGLDQGTNMGVAMAVAAAKMWGFDDTQTANAASLALVPNVPLGASRWGTLSMMKGCATAFSMRNAVFALIMAREGMTSAPEPYEGVYGLHNLTGPFEPRLPIFPGGPMVVQLSHQKPVPAETHGLGILELVPEIRAFTDVDDIDTITIDMPDHAVEHTADPPKYDPINRETADHSVPYMLAVALVDGGISLDSYSDERISDPLLRPIMNKIICVVDDEFSEIRKTGLYGVTRPTPARVTVRTKAGDVWQREIMYYKGHPRNPMSRDDIDAKLDTICDGFISSGQKERIRSAWWSVGESEDVGEAMATLATFDVVGI
jgi:2-methylcitrate dehydratase